MWRHRLGELMAELVIADGGDVSELWSGYLQAVFAVTERLSLVERYEAFRGAAVGAERRSPESRSRSPCLPPSSKWST